MATQRKDNNFHSEFAWWNQNKHNNNRAQDVTLAVSDMTGVNFKENNVK